MLYLSSGGRSQQNTFTIQTFFNNLFDNLNHFGKKYFAFSAKQYREIKKETILVKENI